MWILQEMVNLFVVGQAVSNVFNDKMEVNSGAGIVTVLRGIPHRSNIGFLSLFEHYGNCQVKMVPPLVLLHLVTT